VRVKRYEEAEKVKMKADLLEEFERNKIEAEVSVDNSKSVDASCHPEKGAKAKAHSAAAARGSA